jgi:trehalose 6-phosphate synthase
MARAEVLLASNRGPVSFYSTSDGGLLPRRSGGGLAAGLSAGARGVGALWVCASLSEADRAAAGAAPRGRLDEAGHDTDGLAVRLLPIEPQVVSDAYNGVANSTLWFLHHLLFDTSTQPVFDASFRHRWAAYTTYNLAFAEALAEEAAAGAAVLVQDYHLALTPMLLRELRPDLRIGHFTHTPWAPPEYFAILPTDVAHAILHGMLAADSLGFLTARWADAFLGCCRTVLGARVDRSARTVDHAGRRTTVHVHSLGVDADALRARAARPDVAGRRAAMLAELDGHRLIVRVDRTELSKNLVRGLLAYREVLRRCPAWRGRVVHVVFAYPSRQDLPEYREYTAAVQRLAAEITGEFATGDWQPVLLQVEDDYPRSLAAYRLADVLLVNPIRDGMNLVAKEGPILSERGCVLVLSTEAGAAAELGRDALLVNPYDVSATADALLAALEMPEAERFARCGRLATAAEALPPQAWLGAQIAALASPPANRPR